jgi:hypothetical protein
MRWSLGLSNICMKVMTSQICFSWSCSLCLCGQAKYPLLLGFDYPKKYLMEITHPVYIDI